MSFKWKEKMNMSALFEKVIHTWDIHFFHVGILNNSNKVICNYVSFQEFLMKVDMLFLWCINYLSFYYWSTIIKASAQFTENVRRIKWNILIHLFYINVSLWQTKIWGGKKNLTAIRYCTITLYLWNHIAKAVIFLSLLYIKRE